MTQNDLLKEIDALFQPSQIIEVNVDNVGHMARLLTKCKARIEELEILNKKYADAVDAICYICKVNKEHSISLSTDGILAILLPLKTKALQQNDKEIG